MPLYLCLKTQTSETVPSPVRYTPCALEQNSLIKLSDLIFSLDTRIILMQNCV